MTKNISSRLLIVATLLVAFQSHLIKAGITNSSTEENYDDYDADEPTTTTVINNSSYHWENCTFNGTVYFDDECTEWMRNFYIILTISIAGMALFIFAFVYCGKRCLSNRNGDFERLIENN